MTIYIASLLILIFLSFIALYRTWRIARASDRLSLLSNDVAGGCESIGFTGFSVICSGVTNIEQISSLLGQEYKRYEVIVVIDASQQHHALQSIISRYKLIGVNSPSSTELPTHIRHLYRSRQRGFRRLIVVDTPHRNTYDDINAGVVVASYDHILPIHSNATLFPKAIENLAIMLCDKHTQQVPYIVSLVDGTTLFRRDAIILHGGLMPRSRHQMGRGQNIYTPIIYEHTISKKIFSIRIAIITLLSTLLIEESASQNTTDMLSIILIIGALFITALARAQLLVGRGCSLWEVLYHFRKMVTIFPSRKFIF